MKKILTIIIVLLVLGLGSFIVYDKVLNKPEEMEESIDSDEIENSIYIDKDKYKDITEEVKGLDISMLDEELEFLITFANIKDATDEILLGATYDTDISSEFKIGYTITRVVSKLSEVSFDEWINLMGDVKIKKDTIISLGLQIFEDFSYDNVKNGWSTSGIWNVMCDLEYCYFNYGTYGLTGIMYDGYVSNLSQLKINDDGTKEIISSPVYVEYRYENIDDDITVIVLDYKDGNVIKIYDDCTLEDIMDDEDSTNTKKYCTDFSGYDVNRYTYTFSKDNKLVSVKVN